MTPTQHHRFGQKKTLQQSPNIVKSTQLKTFFRIGWPAACLIIVLTILAYLPIREAGFIWDDDFYVTANTAVQTPEGLAHIWLEPRATPQYYPLVFTTFWIEYRLWGLWAGGYHAVNIVLHILNALLLWRLLCDLRIPGAWLAAAIFALHPVHVESVAWITERKNVLSVLFYLASLFCLVRFAGLTAERPEKRRQMVWYGCALLLFTGALLSKTVTCTLPAALLLVIWWKRGRVERAEAVAMAPFVALGLVMGSMTAWLEVHQVNATGAEWDLTIMERCLIAGRALWFYTAKLLWPLELIFNYPRWEIDTGVWWQYIYPIGIILLGVVLWTLRTRAGRGPLTAFLFFCGSLIPALGFFDVFPFRYSYVADHFQYLASIGLITLLAAAAAQASATLPHWAQRFARALGLMALVLFGLLTWQQSHIYRDIETLWMNTIEKNPSSWMAHTNLGVALAGQGKTDEAVSHFTKALQLNPDHVEAHYNLGAILADRGRQDDAMNHYIQAVHLRPDHTKAHCKLGILLARQGKLDEAFHQYAKALQLDPDYIAAHYNMAALLARQGKLDEAIYHYSEALRLNPGYAEAHNNLGVVLTRQGKRNQAIQHFSEAIRLRPEYVKAHVNLCQSYWLQKDTERAMQEYAIVKSLDAQAAAQLETMMSPAAQKQTEKQEGTASNT